jgi:hypothetical protein
MVPWAHAETVPWRPSLYFAAVNAEFNWWLLIVGLVVGAGLVWVVVMDSRRREVDVDDAERPREAAWLSKLLEDEGHVVSPEAAERLLLLHRAYLEAPPPDDPPTGTVRESEGQPGSDPAATRARPQPSEFAAEDRIGLERRAPDGGR